MRIAYLSEEYPRVSQVHVAAEVQAHRSGGAEVRPFTLRRSRHVDGELSLEDERTRPAPRSLRQLSRAHLALLRSSPLTYVGALRLACRTAPPSRLGTLRSLLCFAQAGGLAHLLREEQLDHLHAHMGDAACSLALVSAALAEVPFSFSLGGPALFAAAERWSLGEKLLRAEFVACGSQHARSQAMAHCPPQEWGKLHVVHEGVDPERFTPREHEAQGQRLLYLGELTASEGLPLLLEAVDTLRHRFPSVSLTLIGDGPERGALRDRCRALGLERHVTFAGHRSQAEVREALRATDVVVYASLTAGIPPGARAALAASVPVVATRAGGLEELIRDGEHGFLVAPGDPDALVDRVAELLADPELRTRLGQAGRAWVREGFHTEREAARLRRLFSASLLGGTRLLGIRPELTEPEQPPSRRIVIVSPCRNEAEFAHRTLDSIVAQTLRPALWVIVDDGSSDETPAILARYAEQHDWIRIVRREDRGKRAVGPGVIDAFYAGWETIDPADFDYVCKLDLDLDMPPRYFETLVERMELNPRLGTCSGKAYFPAPSNHTKDWQGELISESCGDDTSVGATKLYRMECFLEIGGFVRQVMWDGIDCHRCRQRGWKACSWNDPPLRFIHLRPMGSSQKGIVTGRIRHGFGQWFMGTAPSYMLASALFRATRRPFLVGGGAMLWGYLRSALRRDPQLEDPELQRFVRAYQRDVLLRGKRRATQLLDRAGIIPWRSRQRRAPARPIPVHGQQ